MYVQWCIQGGDLGVETPPLTEISFNLLGVFEKKILKHPLNFGVHTKKIIEKFMDMPLYLPI